MEEFSIILEGLRSFTGRQLLETSRSPGNIRRSWFIPTVENNVDIWAVVVIYYDGVLEDERAFSNAIYATMLQTELVAIHKLLNSCSSIYDSFSVLSD